MPFRDAWPSGDAMQGGDGSTREHLRAVNIHLGVTTVKIIFNTLKVGDVNKEKSAGGEEAANLHPYTHHRPVVMVICHHTTISALPFH